MASVKQPTHVTNGGPKESTTEKNLITGTGTFRDGLVQPKKDERYKTEDVTQTKGREFEDFFFET